MNINNITKSLRPKELANARVLISDLRTRSGRLTFESIDTRERASCDFCGTPVDASNWIVTSANIKMPACYECVKIARELNK